MGQELEYQMPESAISSLEEEMQTTGELLPLVEMGSVKGVDAAKEVNPRDIAEKFIEGTLKKDHDSLEESIKMCEEKFSENSLFRMVYGFFYSGLAGYQAENYQVALLAVDQGINTLNQLSDYRAAQTETEKLELRFLTGVGDAVMLPVIDKLREMEEFEMERGKVLLHASTALMAFYHNPDVLEYVIRIADEYEPAKVPWLLKRGQELDPERFKAD